MSGQKPSFHLAVVWCSLIVILTLTATAFSGTPDVSQIVQDSGILNGPVTITVTSKTNPTPVTVTYTQPEDLVGVVQGGPGTEALPSVLVYGADGDTENIDIANKLTATGQFSSVTWTDARAVTPSLATFQLYAAVLTYSNFNYDNSTTLGDNLADYIDAGGGVVLALFADTETNTSRRPQGRFLTDDYFVINSSGQTSGGSLTLGTVFDPSHQTMANVTTFGGGSSSFRPAFSATVTGTRIADWSDGTVLVGVRQIGNSLRADLGFYPPSTDATSSGWVATTDGAVLMANTLSFVAGSLLTGDRIQVSPANVDLGDVEINTTETQTVTITNTSSTDELVINDITLTGTNITSSDLLIDVIITDGQFALDRPAVPFTMDALTDTTLDVSLTPDQVATFDNQIDISSNDPTLSLAQVPVTGNGILVSNIELSPTSNQTTLPEGTSASFPITVSNTGSGTLNWTGQTGTASVTGIQSQSEVPSSAQEHTLPAVIPELHTDNTVSLALYEALVSALDIKHFNDDMESGTGSWTTVLLNGTSDDLWHQTETNANTPTHSWWAGVVGQGNYDTGSRISTALVSPTIDLTSATAPITLDFFENYNTESGFDRCGVDVSSDGGATWTFLRGSAGSGGSAPSGTSGGWIQTTLSLDAFEGDQIQIRFYFDTSDAISNSFPGWFIDDVIVSGAGIDFLSISPPSGSLLPGQSQTVTATIDATGLPTGINNGKVIFTSNDPDNSPLDFPVDATVTAAPDIDVPLADCDFGQVFVGQTSSPIRLQIRNLGSLTLNITSITVDNAVFALSANNATLASNATLDLEITFAPQSEGPQQATLSINSDDPDESLVEKTLLGVGSLPPEIAVDPTQFDESVNAGETRQITLTVSNPAGPTAANLIVKVGEDEVTPPPPPGPPPPPPLPPLIKPVNPGALGPSLSRRHAEGTIYDAGRPDRPRSKPTAATISGVPFAGPFDGNGPLAMAFDNLGNLYVGVSGAILKVLSDGTFTTYVNIVGFPIGLAFDSAGDLFVADNTFGTIYKVTSSSSSGTADVVATPVGSISGFPVGLAFNSAGDLFVVDENSSNPTIWKGTPGSSSGVAPAVTFTPFATGLPGAFGIAIDAQDNILLTTFGAGLVLKIDPQANVTTLISTFGFLEGIAIDVNGMIYVGTGDQGTLKRYNPDGTFESDISTTEVTGFPISLAFGPNFGLSSLSNTVLFVGNGSANSTPFINQVVQFDVGVAGLPLLGDTVPWLSLTPTTLDIPPGQEAQVTGTIRTLGLTPGPYQGKIVLDSNDPNNPTVNVSVNLTVIDAATIVVTPSTLDFGELFLLASTTLTFQVQNTGTQTLSVTIQSNSPEFSAGPLTFVVPPGGSQTVTATIAPTVEGTRNGTYSVSSNDTNDPVVTVSATGVGVLGPDIVASPASLAFTLAADDNVSTSSTPSIAAAGKTTANLTISNVGGAGAADLVWNAQIVYSSNAPSSAGALGSAPPPPPPQANVSSPADRVADEVLVKFSPGIQDDYVRRINDEFGTRTLRFFSQIGVHHIRIESGAGVDATVDAYRNHSAVVYAEPNYIVRADVLPNDPQFPDQWGLNNTGQDGGTPDADIDAPEAWDQISGASNAVQTTGASNVIQTTGASNVIVAIIDSGADLDHPDLMGNLWTNSGETPGNGIDDDNNGFIDDVHGYQ